MLLNQFKHLVGNTMTVSLLQRSLQEGSAKNFMIMAGVLGTGKSSSAAITALYLTCERPNGNEPCIECDSCKANLKALAKGGRTTNLVSYNIGAVKDKHDVMKMINDIFILQGTYGNNVYILEEFHALSKNDQIPFLDEIDKLPENTYVIITTTRAQALLPELRSRAVGSTFQFTRLNNNEAKLLFDRALKFYGVQAVSPAIESMILRYAAGIPRNIVALVDFVKRTRPSEAEVRDFLKYISAEVFIELCRGMSGTMANTALAVDNILKSYPLDMIIVQFKEFIVNARFWVEGGIRGDFTDLELAGINEVLGSHGLSKLSTVVEQMDALEYSEADFKLAIIKMHQIMNNRTPASILSQNGTRAAEQQVDANLSYKQTQRARQSVTLDRVETLNLNTLKSMAFPKEGDSK